MFGMGKMMAVNGSVLVALVDTVRLDEHIRIDVAN